MLALAIAFGLGAIAANIAGYVGCGRPKAAT